jgi:hypothetical protein
MTRVRLTDISPDGVRMVVDWDKFMPGSSVFIPCINTGKALEHVIAAGELDKGSLEKRVGIENGKYGVRIWRMK